VRIELSTFQLFLRAGLPLFLTWLLIPLTFALPLVDSTRAPYFDLTQVPAQFAYWLSQSGGKFGVPIITALAVLLFATRKNVTIKRKYFEIIGIILSVSICAGGGSLINEHVLKTQLRIPRPNIIWLAGENGAGPLGMSPDDFYSSGDKKVRREILGDVLARKPAPVPLSSHIENHWLKETGYSLPSGHSFSAMFLATFLLMSGATRITTKRFWLLYALLPWALAVCYSRPILRVHTPMDITVGGLQGLLAGFAAWSIFRALLSRWG
jgi:phosphatidylglycerophosphatase B